MDASFWHHKWEKNQIAFHNSESNPLLVKYFGELALEQGNRVFVPLCGKTLDIAWLLSNGFRVVGAELSEVAIQQLFEELGIEPKVSDVGNLKHYNGPDIEIFVGDIFGLSAELLGPVDAIYDRAALVALPEQIRGDYTSHLTALTERAPQLLICYVYDQNLTEGPPFSVSNEEVQRHYSRNYELTLIGSAEVPDGLRGQCPAIENIWLLK